MLLSQPSPSFPCLDLDLLRALGGFPVSELRPRLLCSGDLAIDPRAFRCLGRKRSAAGQPCRTDRFSFCSALSSFSSSDAFCYRAECCARDHASGWLQHRKATRTDGKRDCLLCAALLLASAAGYIAIHEFRCPKLWSRPSFC